MSALIEQAPAAGVASLRTRWRDGKAAPVGKVAYALRGRLGGVLGGARFAASGDIDLGV